MEPAQPGLFDLIAGHIHTRTESLEVAQGTLTVDEKGNWSAHVSLISDPSEEVGPEADVTFLGDLCAWSGKARFGRTPSGDIDLTGIGELVLQPAVGA